MEKAEHAAEETGPTNILEFELKRREGVSTYEVNRMKKAALRHASLISSCMREQGSRRNVRKLAFRCNR